MQKTDWIEIGKTEDLIRELSAHGFIKEYVLQEKKVLLSYVDGKFGAIYSRCNHMGGPLAKGRIHDGHVECPWHYWQFDLKTGQAKSPTQEPLASNGGCLPSYPLKIENGNLLINLQSETERIRPSYNPMQDVAREPKRAPGRLRVLGLSTTAMEPQHPRYSTSEDLLKSTLQKAQTELQVDTKFLALSDLKFRHCEGFYSKSEKACTWPCSITKMDPADEMIQVYEALVHWADVVLVGTPIRWGAASSLYYKMAERLNSVQNQITLRDRVLIQNKVAAFIITGGQDNIQAVAGQMLTFFGELGFMAPAFPFVAHSLGWSSEDMEKNMDTVQQSQYLREQSFELVERAVQLAQKFVNTQQTTEL